MGKKTKIAIIDSGVSSTFLSKNNIINCVFLKEYSKSEDFHGHGTALVGMISDFCGDLVELIIIPVLDEKCSCSCNALLAAIDTAIQLKPDIINLSLGTENLLMRKEFQKRCDKAMYQDILLVTTNNGGISLPFILDNTIKVISDKKHRSEEIYINNKSIFLALGVPHIVPWKDSKYIFINRNSFVTPYFIQEFVKNKSTSLLLSNNEIFLNMKSEIQKKSYPQLIYGRVEDPTNLYFYNYIKSMLISRIGNFDESKNLFNQGLSMSKCINLLLLLNEELMNTIPITKFSVLDFEYISNLSNKIFCYFKN